MLEGKAESKYVRMAPRKARRVLELVKGKGVEEALNILHFCPKRAFLSIEKTIRSAIANVIHGEGSNKVDVEKFFIKRAVVNEGPVLKRFMPRAMGRATKIRKKMCHIKIVVSEKEKSQE
jgi:large subunit ribosomal protein L22